MQKTILITGSTDGRGLETAKTLATMGHNVLFHGRNPAKLEKAVSLISELADGGNVKSYLADLSKMAEVDALAQAVVGNHDSLDVLINNAGILKTSNPITDDGLDVRFSVNVVAPYLLTQRLLPLLGTSGRIINLSSAAQSSVDPESLTGNVGLSDDFEAYAQSKLAITMWSHSMAHSLKDGGPVIVAVNPGSLLATKMVKEGFGMHGKDIHIGSDILVRAAISDEFTNASGMYFDNDMGQFGSPHPDALDLEKCGEIEQAIEASLSAN